MPLDREETSMYEIVVLACDQGARCGYTLVRVRVSDENDNSPRFILPEYKTCIHSSLPVNTGFLTVKCFLTSYKMYNIALTYIRPKLNR